MCFLYKVFNEESYGIGNIMDINKYSKLKKLLRVTCWVRRFNKNIKNKVNEKNN